MSLTHAPSQHVDAKWLNEDMKLSRLARYSNTQRSNDARMAWMELLQKPVE